MYACMPMYVWLDGCMYTYVWKLHLRYVCISYVLVCMYVHRYIRAYISTKVCMYVPMYVCMCVYVSY